MGKHLKWGYWLILLAVLVSLCSFACAEDVSLRGYDKKDGYVYLHMGEIEQTKEGEIQPIVWRVLSVENGRAHICSEYILGAGRIHHDDKEWIATNADFSKTELWAFLNGEFADRCFTEEELSLSAEYENLGKFYLLTGDDVKNKSIGFGTDKARKAWGTEYAKANGLFVYSLKHGKHSPYWTMSQSTAAPYGARCTKAKGNIGYIRVVVMDEGWRPVCRLDTTKLVITGGAGTLEDPYKIAGKKAE